MTTALTHETVDGGFGIYVHWPFCAAKCPYCDFNSHVRTSVDEARWGQAYVAEIAAYGARLPGREVSSVFFGGGTPSLMSGSLVESILSAISKAWNLSPDVEVTLEANPSSVDAARFRDYKAAGVNRLSLGVQSFDDAELKTLGRIHSAAEARDAIALARNTFERMSFDLIYARPGQTLKDWESELTTALDLSADHLSLYQLTIEEGTKFETLYKAGHIVMPQEDHALALYDATEEICAAHGLHAYEVSNYARPGAEGRHNLTYWHYGDYVGIGPGAHGRLREDGRRLGTQTERFPEKWLALSQAAPLSATQETVIEPVDQGAEYLLMGLRLSEGISLARYSALAGRSLTPGVLADLCAQDLMALKGDRLRATARGRHVLNTLIAALLS